MPPTLSGVFKERRREGGMNEREMSAVSQESDNRVEEQEENA